VSKTDIIHIPAFRFQSNYLTKVLEKLNNLSQRFQDWSSSMKRERPGMRCPI